MSAPDLPRFVVSSDTYSILDSWDCYRVVAVFGTGSRGAPEKKRAAQLEDRRVEFEAWHKHEMVSG